MHFELSEEQLMIQRTAADYARRRLSGAAAARDREGTFPETELRELAGLGLMAINVPESLGGVGAGVVAYALAMQELARGDGSVAVAVSVTNMVAELIARFGTDDQKHDHLAALVGGDYLCAAFALSEPEVGSDPAAIACRAEKTDSGWMLTGTKQWVSNGGFADLMVVWAVTEPGAGHRGITAFLVPGAAKGVSVARHEDKMGLRGSSTAQIVLDEVELSDAAVLGEVGSGFKLAMIALDGGRIGVASQALGIARMALQAALDYARERHTFGKPIIAHQAVGNMLADAATWIEAAHLMVLRAAYLKESGRPFTKEASMAKLFASEKACQVCDLAIQIHGGYGYTLDFPVERAYRDVRVTRIYEGTSEIQRLVIARHLIQEAAA
jgi:hypothetical protein